MRFGAVDGVEGTESKWAVAEASDAIDAEGADSVNRRDVGRERGFPPCAVWWSESGRRAEMRLKRKN